ncbi:PepSY-associated TM helix domain-containing protein [Methylobacterium sp. J-076]|uniref:PepSY-associated TM helix domain-containing protein n=1 Tax=Methylobacterium sp. J-076 TaxID=2836655 RepID=UPI002444758A
MAWLHAWAGLVVGWVLFAVFATGTASYYRAEISRWARPELPPARTFGPAELADAAGRGVAYLQERAGGARTWFITLPRPEMPVLELFWRTGPGHPPGHVLLDPDSGAPAAVRATRGGDFFYRFHFELSMAPLWGRWIVGFCAMVMLVALISGVVTHRRIFVDFFTFRRRADQRGWLDAHNLAGVLALPFHLMITYTGLVTLMLMYMPWGLNAAYRGDSQRYFAEGGQITAPRPPAGRPGTLAPVGPMVSQAATLIDRPLERLTVVNPRDAHATVVAVFGEPHGLSHEHPQVAFDGPSGAVLEVRAGGLEPAAKTFTTMVGLHEAHFAGPALRALFFLCGLAGSAMVATGLVLWTVARLPASGAAAPVGLRIVRVLNVATIAGLPGAGAAYLLANRLLPVALPERAEWEVRVFFAAWLAVLLVAILRPHRRAWVAALTAAAGLFAAVAVADAALSPAPPFLAVDGAMLALSALFTAAARRAPGHRGTVRRAAAPKAAVAG